MRAASPATPRPGGALRAFSAAQRLCTARPCRLPPCSKASRRGVSICRDSAFEGDLDELQLDVGADEQLAALSEAGDELAMLTSSSLSSQDSDFELSFSQGAADGDALAGATPALRSAGQEVFEQILDEAAAGEELTFDRITEVLPYEMDAFQKDAVRVVLQGRSVVVCAPTGAGKTAIAVASAVAVVARKKKVIYTTPLKALSNQKFRELKEVFGEHRVGLRTGDVTINMSAEILVMTTEILRNISYRMLLEEEPSGLRQNLDDVGLAVLDEVHYLGNRDRGSVWEEIIINCPKHVQMLAMSATVANADELGAWISQVHGPCENVTTSFRPVPLKWWFAWSGADQAAPSQLVELLQPTSDHTVRMNPAVEPTDRDYDDRLKALTALTRGLQGRSLEEQVDAYWEIERLKAELVELDQASRAAKREVQPTSLVQQLAENDMLPAIYFMFSRKRCNETAMKFEQCMVERHEQLTILRELNELRATQPEAVPKFLVEPLLNGVASHHAGLLPGWKALVETLFQAGLIKVVFATETLAAGINMPARTTVISALSRRRDTGYAALLHNEVLQMAGRAGRRGYDSQGHCIITQSRWEGAQEGVSIIAKGPEPIDSQFNVSYGMVLNLLSTRQLEECRTFLDRSFLRYQATAGMELAMAEAQRLESEAIRLLATEVPENTDLLKQFAAAKTALKVEKSALRAVRGQAISVREELACEALGLDGGSRTAPASLRTGDAETDAEAATGRGRAPPAFPMLVVLDLSREGPLQEDLRSALCLGPAASFNLSTDLDLVGFSLDNLDLFEEEDALVCLGGDNRLYLVRAKQVAAVRGNDDLNVLLERVNMTFGKLEEVLLDCLQASLSQRWRRMQLGVLAAPSSSASARVALEVAMMELSCPMLLDGEEWQGAVDEAFMRVKMRKVEYRALKEEAEKAMKAANARPSPGVAEEAAKMKRAARQLRQSHTGKASASWEDFTSTVEVLKTFEAVVPAPGPASEGPMRLTDLGFTARDIRFENELWLAMVLDVHGFNPGLMGVKPSTLAGLMCALVTPFQVVKADALTSMEASEELKLLVEGTSEIASRLSHEQARRSVVSPIQVDLRFAGAVERWVWMEGWAELTEQSTLDDGDIARLLSRVADLLKQVSVTESVDEQIRATARQAYKRVYRQPICDLLGG